MNSTRAQTSEQVDVLLDSLRATQSETGQHTTPFEYKEDYQEMYSLLCALEKPQITMTNTSDSFKLEGRTFPLELFLQDIGLIKTANYWEPPQLSADLEAGSVTRLKGEVLELCAAYGFVVNQAF